MNKWILLVLVLAGCTTLTYPPPPTPIVQSLSPATTGVIAEATNRFFLHHPDDISGFLALVDNQEALEWRLALVDHAVQSIDVQYFIWQGDAVGALLFDRLLKAADRGVRVRMLVDDFLIEAKDREIAAITKHPNFDIKIYNPGMVRDSTLGRIGEFMLYFKELNRRMHNKLFIADNHMAIVGGRNIGNAYFGLSEKYNFRDLDVLVIGEVIEELSSAFDQYWNTELAYPCSAMSERETVADLNESREELSQFLNTQQHLLTAYRLHSFAMENKIRLIPLGMTTGEANFIQDEPSSLDGEEPRLVDMLDYIAEPSESELIMVSPYLIPVKGTLEELAEAEAEGVQVKLITGSMGANNHTMTHSHYKKYRRPILATGAELFEFRHDPSQSMRDISDVPPVEAEFICLHTKAIVADKERCFVGSLNLDPRAIEINTENGLYIDSAEFCGRLAAEFESLMAPENAWQVYIDADDFLRWESSAGKLSIQPARTFWQRVADFFFRLLPIESLL